MVCNQEHLRLIKIVFILMGLNLSSLISLKVFYPISNIIPDFCRWFNKGD